MSMVYNSKGVGLVYDNWNWKDIINELYYCKSNSNIKDITQRDINIFKINRLYKMGTIDISMRDELLSMVKE